MRLLFGEEPKRTVMVFHGTLILITPPGLIKQFLRDVFWGELDYLVIDTPPGTSDEHISIAQYLKATQIDGAVIITTPQVKFRISKHRDDLIVMRDNRKWPWLMCARR